MDELYERYRKLLFRLAYQLTGSAADAEDAVQDVFVKAHGIHAEQLGEPKAYLCKMVTNRCLDQLKSARRRRESYVGPWLPEPLPTGEADDAFDGVERADLLSYGMLALLERLTPVERTVFVLREALDFDYPAIAEMTGKSEANCRKILSRAKGKMGIGEDDLIARGASVEAAWVGKFLHALSQGEVGTVMEMLAEDAVLLSDGGGYVSAAVRPVHTRERVARFLLGVVAKFGESGGFETALAPINGEWGLVIRSGDIVDSVVFVRMAGQLLQEVYIVRNPEKLSRIG